MTREEMIERADQENESFPQYIERQSWLPENERATSGRHYEKQQRDIARTKQAKKKKASKAKRIRDKGKLYPPPKTEKSHLLRKRLQSRIDAYYDKKDAKVFQDKKNKLLKERLEREKRYHRGVANIPSELVQSPSLKAELVKKEKAKELARQRKNLRKKQEKIKGAQILKKFMEQHQDL